MADAFVLLLLCRIYLSVSLALSAKVKKLVLWRNIVAQESLIQR